MLNLQRVTMFIAVVDAGSFTLAAAALGQTGKPPGLSSWRRSFWPNSWKNEKGFSAAQKIRAQKSFLLYT